MKKTKELQELRVGRWFAAAVLTIAFALCLSLFSGHLSIVSHAESTGRITASGGARVRSSASSNASQVTSIALNETVSIISQVQADDGYTWYEVWVDAETKGYIRSDLVEITDGTTPDTSSGGNSSQSTNVTRVNPISATVKGGNSGVRVRSSASSSSGDNIVTTAQNGTALTVNGYADSLDGDGKVWYQVNFISNGSEITGFIRQDYVELSGDLTPYTEPTVDPGTEEDPDPVPETPVQPEVSKEYDTFEQDGKWLVKTPEGVYEIEKLLENNAYVGTLSNNEKKVKSQKVVIVIMVLLLIAAAGVIGFLVFKIKDMMDSAYFNAVENETLRRRRAQTGQSGRVMQTVGADKKGAPQGQRPSGAPQGQRPSGAPQGQRPTGAPQGQRPSGAPQGQRPTGAPQGQRPAGAPQGQRPSGAPQGQRPTGAPQEQKSSAPQNQGSSKPQPKNFMSGEEEFEFEFLNYDDEGKK